MRKHFTDLDLNRSVGNLLRIGVVLSVTTSLIGFIKLFAGGFHMPKHYEDLKLSEENIFRGFWMSLKHLDAMAIIQLGILFLIATPVMRIIFALIGYLKERDYLYVVISFIVLAIITASFLLGFG